MQPFFTRIYEQPVRKTNEKSEFKTTKRQLKALNRRTDNTRAKMKKGTNNELQNTTQKNKD